MSSTTAPRLGRLATCALALALFLGVFALRLSDPNVGDAEEVFFVVPVGVLALRFGLRGGLAGALSGFALVGAWDRYHHPALSMLGVLDRGVAFLMLGVLLGVFVDRRARLEAGLLRYYDASLDLLATADLTGRFTRVNPAWERALGHSAETMCSQPLVEFVHPEDREATIAETVAIANRSRESVGFRNRFRAADGSYRWLEWNASLSPSERVVHAVARDVTVQQKAEQQLANSAKRLQERVEERTHQLDVARAETLRLLAVVSEYRDDGTYQHTQRVGMIAAEIAVRLGLPAAHVTRLREAAPLHDIGKIATPDSILLKPGRLSAQEQDVMKRHTALGTRLLSSSSSPVLQMAAVISATHHEWWDGTGYPNGLAGERIPLVGRMVAVADVFDALTHDRPYKPAWPVKQAIARIHRAAGSQFDPRVVTAFLTLHTDTVVASASNSPQEPVRPVGAPRQRPSSPATRPAPTSARYAARGG
jgi:PAS domain S-box-containing protein/putative nucleotidyltransferase with HDIG domain